MIRFIIAFICFVSLQWLPFINGEKSENVHQNITGVYHYISVRDLLQIQPGDPFFLSLVCPKTLLVNGSETQSSVNISFLAEEERNSTCSIKSSNASQSTVSFQKLSVSSAASARISTRKKLSIENVAEHFPLLVGNLMNGTLECALLNASIPNAQIVAQDVGYFHTLLNFYKQSGSTLGSAVSEIDATLLAPIEHSFSLNVAVDTANGIGCSYLKESDETRLRQGIAKLYETPSPSPSVPPQNASVSPSKGDNSDEGSESACFPSTARVMLSNGTLVRMSSIREGDVVLDGAGTYSKVLMFTHADSEVESEFVLLKTGTGSIVASGSHYLYVNGELKAARLARVGDTLSEVDRERTESISAEKVVEKKTLRLAGLYNPQTVSGSVVVFWDGNGVKASTYTESIAPVLAHILLAPLRWAESNLGATFPSLTRGLAKGDSALVAVVRALLADAGKRRL